MVIVNPEGGGPVLVMVIEKLCDCLAPALSVTVAVNVNVPAVAGVPLILPEAWSVNPEVEIDPAGDQV